MQCRLLLKKGLRALVSFKMLGASMYTCVFVILPYSNLQCVVSHYMMSVMLILRTQPVEFQCTTTA